MSFIRGISGGGRSSYVNYTFHYVLPAPSPVRNLTLIKQDARSLAWKWVEPEDNGGRPVDGYTVEVRTLNGSNGTKPFLANITSTEFTLSRDNFNTTELTVYE